MNRRAVFKPKILEALRSYSFTALYADIGAGVTVGAIALPLSLALGFASGVRPVQGIYTAVVAGLIVGFLGGSRFQIAGPTAAFVPIVYGIVLMHGIQNLYLSSASASKTCGEISTSRWRAPGRSSPRRMAGNEGGTACNRMLRQSSPSLNTLVIQ